MMQRFRMAAAFALATSLGSFAGSAQPPSFDAAGNYGWAEMRLADSSSDASPRVSSPSDRREQAADVARLRQQRAAYRYNQMVSRLETNAWLGYEPLRPGWSAVPMMSSRYPARQTIIVPVYID